MLREDVIVVITIEERKKLITLNDWLDVSYYPRLDLADQYEAGRIKDVRFFFKSWDK